MFHCKARIGYTRDDKYQRVQFAHETGTTYLKQPWVRALCYTRSDLLCAYEFVFDRSLLFFMSALIYWWGNCPTDIGLRCIIFLLPFVWFFSFVCIHMTISHSFFVRPGNANFPYEAFHFFLLADDHFCILSHLLFLKSCKHDYLSQPLTGLLFFYG